jgi:hypothetical protein
MLIAGLMSGVYGDEYNQSHPGPKPSQMSFSARATHDLCFFGFTKENDLW